MPCVCLPVRAVAARHLHPRRLVRLALTCAWIAIACWLVTAVATTTAARNTKEAGQRQAFGPNQPPRILFYAFYQGDGIWQLCGSVHDESPIGMEVELSGGPLEETLHAIVQPNGSFCISSETLGAGIVFANTTDNQGLPAPETFAYIGF